MQIALLVIPHLVVLGCILGKDDTNLAFDGDRVAALFIAMLLVSHVIQNSNSNWSVIRQPFPTHILAERYIGLEASFFGFCV